MADLAITAANVVPGTNAKISHGGFAGEAITAGQPVYLAAATQRWMKADNDAVASEARAATGIALTGSSTGQPVAVQTAGDITLGAVLTAGTPYYLSATAGGICPVGDLVTGKTVCQLGLAKSASVLALAIQNPGVTL
jgi:hypothetical protein